MKKLLAIEWGKLRKYRVFWSFMALYCIAIPSMLFGLGKFDFSFILSKKMIFGFPNVYAVTSWLSSFMNLFMSITIITLTCNEFEYKTLRQHEIDGLSRKELIFGKFSLVVLLSVFIAIYTFLVASIAGMFFTDTFDIFNGIDAVGVYLIQTLGYFSLAFLLAIILKKSSLSIIVLILIILFDGITIGLLLPKNIYAYFPTEVFSNLTPFPFFRETIDNIQNQGKEVVKISKGLGSALSIFYTFLIVYGAYFVVKKRDL